MFYKLYKFSDSAPSRWLSDWKAGIIIVVLEILVIASLFVYYKVIFNRNARLSDSNWDVIACVMIVVIPNYFAFVHSDVWRIYAEEFDRLPRNQNKAGCWIVLGVVLSVILNFIFSIYLMSEIDWSLYR